MVNNKQAARRVPDLDLAAKVLYAYVGLTVATLIALAVMSGLAPRLAPNEAWGHQVIVTIFAVVLPLRMRAARRGSAGAVRAVAIIAVVLGVVNLVEAALPVFPGWMRVVMLVVAALMAALVAVVTGRVGARPVEG